ncbi:transporter substrate-binding domain-containing protein [Halopiger xanaduensis]|uniref:ABC-type transporter, periplasmic subunit family 3 n=1 Tax=Halopiger xanaduensis (strain DSM 18323 / JCM 14033 / SH-6) TaxID=797210 RepID=F8DAM1_HALXS|nr:transporter substrate-binding domain-containing protein [Halopiger xanaduensis]AEH35827.1 ABC-type transporter, periplasmic subunit family 3 [Halopiger xanaduensis SH-6]
MVDETEQFDRRTYLKLTGTAGVTVTGLAGCLEDAGNGNGDESGNGNGDSGNGSGNGNGSDEETNESDGSDGGDDNQIIAGTAPGFEPFEMTRDGELVGFDIDLLEAVVDETEYELAEWNEYEFDSLIPALENGNIDVIAAAMTITEERQQSIAFTEPYYSANQSVLVQSGGDFAPEALEDLEDREVGAQSGTTGETVVQEQLIDEGLISDDQYTSYDNYVYAVQELERGLLDAIVIDEPVGATFADSRDVEVAFTFETGEEYGFGVQQDASDLQTALSDGIAAVRESGQYDEITQTWFDSDENAEE